jgi:hypothetical protein
MKTRGRSGRKASAADNQQRHTQDSDAAGKKCCRSDQQRGIATASRRSQYHQVAARQQTSSWTLKQRGEKPASTSTTYLEPLPYATAQAKPEVLR